MNTKKKMINVVERFWDVRLNPLPSSDFSSFRFRGAASSLVSVLACQKKKTALSIYQDYTNWYTNWRKLWWWPGRKAKLMKSFKLVWTGPYP